MSSDEIERKIAVILATDVVGYSKHMEANEKETVKNLKVCEQILTKVFKLHKGRLFNTGGDSFFIEFPSAVEAVECAVSFQKMIKERNDSDKTTVPLEFRIGINTGDVIKDKGNLLGDGVNIAARLEALAQPKGISISKAVYDFIKGKTEFKYNDLGVQKIKQNEFHAYDILLDPSQKRKLNTSKSNKPIIAAISVFVIALIGGLYYFNFSLETIENKSKTIISDKPSVLVLLFENQTNNRDNDFIGMGITNHIISTLSMNEKLLIPTMNTGKYIQENNLLDNQIKDEYGIEYILRGSVQEGQGKMRVNVQMSDLSKNEIIWSEIYDFKKNEDIFEIQDDLGNSILRQLQIKFHYAGFDQNISRNPEVYKKFIYGEAAFQNFTVEGTHKAEKLWREALELEPDNPRLGQYLGWIHWRKVTLGISSNPKEDMEKAYNYALDALEKNEDWFTPYTAVALIELYSGKIDQACSRLEKMNALTNSSSAEMSYKALIQHSCDDLIGAKASYETVFKTNPHHESWIKYMYGYVLTELKNYENAKQYISEQLKNNFSRAGVEQILYITLAYIHEKEGNKKLAKKMFEIQKEKDGKGISADQIHRRFITKKDKSFLEDIIKTFKPYGLQDK